MLVNGYINSSKLLVSLFEKYAWKGLYTFQFLKVLNG